MNTERRAPREDIAGEDTGAENARKVPRKRSPRSANPTPPDSIVYMTSTEAQNSFGRLLELVARNGTVLITKHHTAQAVVMSVEQYEALRGGSGSDLDTLTAEFDDLLERMQAPEARAGLREAFRASPDELARAAVAAAQRATE